MQEPKLLKIELVDGEGLEIEVSGLTHKELATCMITVLDNIAENSPEAYHLIELYIIKIKHEIAAGVS